jgi:hypothetical protein
MRLSKDTTSWKAQGLLVKQKPLPEQPVHRSKKDTKKWCKGIVGREHDYEYQHPHNDLGDWRLVPVCLNCGRQDYHDILYWCSKHEEWEADLPYWNH